MNLEQLLDEYYEKFGENYPLEFPSTKTDGEIIEDIRRCLKEGKLAEEPTYYPEFDY